MNPNLEKAEIRHFVMSSYNTELPYNCAPRISVVPHLGVTCACVIQRVHSGRATPWRYCSSPFEQLFPCPLVSLALLPRLGPIACHRPEVLGGMLCHSQIVPSALLAAYISPARLYSIVCSGPACPAYTSCSSSAKKSKALSLGPAKLSTTCRSLGGCRRRRIGVRRGGRGFAEEPRMKDTVSRHLANGRPVWVPIARSRVTSSRTMG